MDNPTYKIAYKLKGKRTAVDQYKTAANVRDFINEHEKEFISYEVFEVTQLTKQQLNDRAQLEEELLFIREKE